MRKFGVYHQCYKNKRATEFAINNFRKYNPKVPYYLISDCGDDFSDLAQKYDCKYVFSKDNIGMDYLPKQDVILLYNRLKDCFKTLEVDYLLLMEDDVLCRGEIQLDWDFNLAMSNIPGNKLKVYDILVNKYNLRPNCDWYGACGGSILNRNLFDSEDNEKLIMKFIEEDFFKDAGSMDHFITTIYMLCGYECSVNKLMGETHRTPQWEQSNLPIIHNYKQMY